MSDDPHLGFTKFVPGFDFLQNLAKGSGAAMPPLPQLSNWVAPTLNVEELDKRVEELRAVHFWLEQNAKALGATIQALEVQKMTLATLKGMNFPMADVAAALQLNPLAAAGTPAAPSQAKPRKPAAAGAAAASLVDPLQWWGSLTQQFQQIAADAFKDAGRTPAVDDAASTAAGSPAKDAGAGKAKPRKTAARKPRAG